MPSIEDEWMPVLESIRRHAAGARVIWDFDGVVGHTEQWIWERVIADGFPATSAEIPALHAERGEVVAGNARRDLHPSWLASESMPALAGIAAEQVVVSNGDPDLIGALLRRWNLDAHVRVARREARRDKEVLFSESCVPPCVVLEDSDTYLRLGRDAGVFTVGVRHSHNPRAVLEADVVTRL